MSIIELNALDLALAAVLVVAVAGLSLRLRLGLERPLLVAAVRTVVQLSLVGLVLGWVFRAENAWVVLAMGLVMLLVAGREVMRRQARRLAGWWGYGTGTLSMLISSFAVTIFAMSQVIHVDPWYKPQYAIPLLGMLLGNTMNGIAIGLDRLTDTAWRQRAVIEQRLALGETWNVSIHEIRQASIRAALIPIVNTMSVVGLVSLPGMMTGQILAGNSPTTAVKYQILIMFLIAAGTGFGSMLAVRIASRRLFDRRERLRLDRLR